MKKYFKKNVKKLFFFVFKFNFAIVSIACL